MYESADERSLRLRHDVADNYHHIRLCFDILGNQAGVVPRLEWLRRIEAATERCGLAAAELEHLHSGQDPPPHALPDA